MLTKNSLKYTRRADSIFPCFLENLEPEMERYLDEMQGSLKQAVSVGSTHAEITRHFKILSSSLDQKIKNAFHELLLDRADFGLKEARDFVDDRWEQILAAQKIRHSIQTGDIPSFESYEDTLTQLFKLPISELRQSLYGDLPEAQVIRSYKELGSQGFVLTYNRALASLALQFARVAELSLPRQTSHDDLRQFIHKVKNLRLLCEISQNEKAYIIKVTGPLGVNQYAIAYGGYFRQLMSLVFKLKNWSLKAEVEISGRLGNIAMSQVKHGHFFQAHDSLDDQHSDLEAKVFMASFAEKVPDHTIELAREWFSLPGGALLFPDYLIKRKSTGKKTYLECFSPWSEAILISRLKDFDSAPHLAQMFSGDYIIAVDKKLGKKKTLSSFLNASPYFASKGILFNDFPSITRLQKHL